MPVKPTVTNRKIVAESALFQITRLDLTFSNGQKRQFERLGGKRGTGSVMIVPMLDNETILLVREYGAGIEEYFLGLPKGAIEQDEDLFETANRELMEEVGYSANKMQELKPMVSSAAYSSSAMRLILARDLYPKRLDGDEPEPIEVVPWSLKKLPELIMREDFPEARSVAALFLVQELLRNEK